MKNPKKPVHPPKVVPPAKTIQLTRSHTLVGRVKLSEVIEMLPRDYPLDKATLVMEDEFQDEDEDYYCSNNTLLYKVEEPNQHYNGQIKAYHRNLRSYAKKVAKYNADMETYIKDKAAFDAWFKAKDKKRRIEDARRRITTAKKELQRLKSQ